MVARPSPAPPPRADRALWVACVVLAVVVVAHGAWMVEDFGGERLTLQVDDYGELVASAVAAWSCWRCSRRASLPTHRRLGWRLLASACLSWSLGQAVYSWYEVVRWVDVPSPSLADLGFLLFVPLAVAGLLCFVRSPAGRGTQLRSLFDALIAGGSILFCVWQPVLHPILRTDAGDHSQAVIDLSYPVGDVILLTLVAFALTRAVSVRRSTLALLLGGMAALAVADSGYAYLALVADVSNPGLAYTGWVAGFLLIAVAAMRDRSTEAVERSGHRVAAASLSYALIVAALATAIGLTAAGRTLDTVSLVIAGSFVLLLVVDQWTVVLENDALTTHLERLVRERTSQLEHQAFHDSLTGLANRERLRHRTSAALASGGLGSVGMLLLDLDDFKAVNDSLGHPVGDAMLCAVAERLTATLPERHTVARLGGDEFAVLLEGLASPDEALTIAHELIAVLAEPAMIDGRELRTAGSLGVALAVSPTTTVDELVRDADVAMYVAKSQRKGSVALFDPQIQRDQADRLQLTSDLRRAPESGQLVLHYQPVFDLVRQRISGVEALVRWQHPERGLLPPFDFIPLAEESGLIVGVGRWVLEQACLQAAAWQRSGHQLSMCVNVSARQLRDPDFTHDVRQSLAVSGMDPSHLVLELTESLLLEERENATALLVELKSLGIRIAIDDFGTGYSSMSYLHQLPLDILKIDRSFVSGMTADPQRLSVTRAVVELARSLNLTSVAEGVEDEKDLEVLRSLGCDAAQGFWFSRPVEPHTLTALLELRDDELSLAV